MLLENYEPTDDDMKAEALAVALGKFCTWCGEGHVSGRCNEPLMPAQDGTPLAELTNVVKFQGGDYDLPRLCDDALVGLKAEVEARLEGLITDLPLFTRADDRELIFSCDYTAWLSVLLADLITARAEAGIVVEDGVE